MTRAAAKVWCSMRVNATKAACLVGVSDKTMGAWLKAYGTEWGAQKVRELGRPEEWEIDLVDLYRATGHRVHPDHVRMLSAWLDLLRGTGGGGTLVAPASPSPAPSGTSSADAGRSPEPSTRIPGTFRNATEAARWLMTHGLHAESTVKSWPGWPPSRLDPANVLALAIERQDTGNWRITWRLHECDNPTCVCHTML